MALNEIDLAQVKRSGEHFKKTLRELFENIPPKSRSIIGLHRWTKVNKSTCQRLVQALTKSTDGIDVVIKLPGPDGLQQFIKKFKKLFEDKSKLGDFDQMIQEYQNLIFSYASSQSNLKRVLLQSSSKTNLNREQYFKKLRMQAYQTNRELTGESIDLYFGIHVIKENKEDKTTVDETVVANRIGVELAKNARPFVQTFTANQGSSDLLPPVAVAQHDFFEESKKGHNEYLLTDFSSPDIGKSFAGVGSLGNNLIYNQNLNPSLTEKFDITMAFQVLKGQKSPLHGGPKVMSQGLMQRSPAKKLILLTLMNKKLDKRSAVQGGCYPSSVRALEIGHNPEDLWSDKFSDSSEIKILDTDSESMAEKTGVDNADQLIAEVMRLLRDDVTNYTGYFLEVDYPLWLTSQRFYFDFS